MTEPRERAAPTAAEPSAIGLAAAATGIVLLTLAAYANSFSGVVVFDDVVELYQNQRLASLPPWSAMFAGNKLPPRPLPYFTFSIDYALWGNPPWNEPNPGWHLVNLGVHVTSALLLFGIARRALVLPRLKARYGDRATVTAFFIAAIWAVHPLETQAVTYIYQRIEAMMGMFALASLYSFLRGIQTSSRGWFAASVAACGLASWCKESAVVILPLVMLFDRLLVAASWRELYASRRRYYAALALSYLPLFVYLLANSGNYNEFREAMPAPWRYAVNQPPVILHYLRLFVLPYGQTLDYSWFLAEDSSVLIAPALLLAALFAVAVFYVWRRPQAAWLLAACVVPLLPTSSFLPVNDLANEHRMYLPAAALSAAVVLSADALLRRLAAAGRPIVARVAGGFCGIAVLAICIALTHQRNQVYASRLALWSDVVAKAPGNGRGHFNLALAYYRRDDMAKTLEHTQRALELGYVESAVHYYYGTALLHFGNRELAITNLRRAVALDPGHAMSRVHLGVALRPLDRDQAVALFNEALAIDPTCVEALANLANDKARRGDFRGAAAQFQEALRLAPDDERLQKGLAMALDDLKNAR